MIKLLRYLKKYWLFALLAPLFMVGEVTMDMLVTGVMGQMIDTVNSFTKEAAQNEFIRVIVLNGLKMIGFVAVGVAAGILSGVFANLASQNFANDLRKDVFKKIMNLSFQQTDDFSTGSLVTRVTNDITQVQNMIATAIRMFVRSAGMFILGIIFTLSISTKFAVVLGIALPLEIIIIFLFMRKSFPLFKIIQSKLDRVNSVVHENLTGARVVKAFSKEDYEYDRFVAANNDLTGIMLKVNKMMALIMPLFMGIVYCATIAIYYTGYTAQVEGAVANILPGITVGDTQKAVTYISMIMFSMIMIGMTFANLAGAIASASRINEVLDTTPTIKEGNLDITTLKEKGTIEFKDVSFTYPLAKAPVLEHINVSIKQGETVAVVGSTGSGKSTLVNLITRFYDVTEGSLLVDGVDVREYKTFDLRNKIAIVLQKAELFAATMEENIKWGKPDASFEEVVEAAQIAQAEEFILSKEEGYNCFVEEKGTSLSGGQKQRLSIARAIVKKPEILIFDDSTSALDLVTEAHLHKAMRSKLAMTTKIIVAQRIATAKNCDKIIVLDNGTIVAYDTHENLLKTSPVYQDIYNSQLKREGEING